MTISHFRMFRQQTSQDPERDPTKGQHPVARAVENSGQDLDRPANPTAKAAR